jgi:hypothetical protein
MGMPKDVGAVDLMIAFPHADASVDDYTFRSLLHDEGSADMVFPVEYIFKDVPNHLEKGNDPIEVTLVEMDKCGIAIGLLGGVDELSRRAVREHPDRFRVSIHVDPNDITGSVRQIRAAHDEFGIKAVQSFPAGCVPQVPVSDRRYYPVYQTCIDLDLPMITNAGVPGPRVPMDCQDVRHFDQMAGALLHDQCFRAQVLPEGDHRLCQHPGRRQDHVCRVLPDGDQPRAHIQRDAERSLPRPRMAQVPQRERHACLQAGRIGPGRANGEVEDLVSS